MDRKIWLISKRGWVGVRYGSVFYALCVVRGCVFSGCPMCWCVFPKVGAKVLFQDDVFLQGQGFMGAPCLRLVGCPCLGPSIHGPGRIGKGAWLGVVRPPPPPPAASNFLSGGPKGVDRTKPSQDYQVPVKWLFLVSSFCT